MARITSVEAFVDRATQDADVIYVHDKSGMAFVTTDGIGRYWFDTVDEAIEEFGDDLDITYVDHICDYEECEFNTENFCAGGQA